MESRNEEIQVEINVESATEKRESFLGRRGPCVNRWESLRFVKEDLKSLKSLVESSESR